MSVIDLAAHRTVKADLDNIELDKIGTLISTALNLAHDRPLLAYLLAMAALEARRAGGTPHGRPSA